LSKRLYKLQEMLFTDGRHSLLVVLQAMDAAGKDSTIRSVFGPINPQGCRVVSFKAPSSLELHHDYLWRVHAQAPPKGYMTVFNRSHYEDVLIVRVKNLVHESVWSRRYDHINDFERLLSDEGTVIRKFFLHIGKDYQRERLQRRLDRPDKLWKFNPKDLDERARWPAYMQAYEACLSRCSTETAPWYVIPSEQRWYRDLLIAQALVQCLEDLNLRHPEPDFDPAAIRLD
jgi:PPK2 family polyphosphate:nucleotide phosphotransferase